MHFRDGEPMPCDADEADDSLVACLHRGVQRSAFPQRELPLDHVHQVVQLEQIDPIDAETIERSANLLARPRVVALLGLRGDEETVGMTTQPRRDSELGVAVGSSGVDVVHAVLEQ